MLRMEIVPDSGGDTLFADMYQAFDSLSAPVQQLVLGLTARHDPKGHHLYLSGEKALHELPSQVHPVVRTHPDTGRKALFVNEMHTERLADMTVEESQPLLRYLYDHAVRPEFTCRFRWEPGSIAFWDNRCVQHYALNDYPGERREMNRITVQGDVPY